MAVLLPNARLTVHAHVRPVQRDPHGKPVGGSTDTEARGPMDGAVVEPFDGGYSQNQWVLRVEPELGPIAPGDYITDDQGRKFIARYAKLNEVPGYGWADYIRVTADLDPPKEL